jgi:hypothetical protein
MTTIHVSFAVVETAKSLLLKKFLEIFRLVSTTMATLALVGRQPFVRAHAEHDLSVATLTTTKNTIAAKTTDPDEASAPTADVSNHFFHAASLESNKRYQATAMNGRQILPLAALRLVLVDASLWGKKLWVLLEELLESKQPATALATVTVTPTEAVPASIALIQIRAHAAEVIVPRVKLASLRL